MEQSNKFKVEIIAWFDQCRDDNYVKGVLTARLLLKNKTLISKKGITLTESFDFFQASTTFSVDKV